MYELLPVFLAFCHLVKLFLDVGGEVVVHNAREGFQEEVVDHQPHVGRHQLALLAAHRLGARSLLHLAVGEDEHRVGALRAFLVALRHIAALLNGRNRWRVGRRAADAQFFELMHERSFVVACRRCGETLAGRNLRGACGFALRHLRQHAGSVFALAVAGKATVGIDAQETVELHHLAVGHERFGLAVDGDNSRSLLNQRVRHLAGERALADQGVEAAFLCRAFNLGAAHVGGTNGLVRLLRSLGVRVVGAALMVFLAHALLDDGAAGVEAQRGEIGRVGTHVGDETRLVERLSHAHRGRNAEA